MKAIIAAPVLAVVAAVAASLMGAELWLVAVVFFATAPAVVLIAYFGGLRFRQKAPSPETRLAGKAEGQGGSPD